MTNGKEVMRGGGTYMELYAAALVTGRYLRVAVVLLSFATIGLIGLNVRTQAAAARVKPLVIRIDDVGRATALRYEAWAYRPQVPELKYFLVQFARRY
jgi:type IV secretory pathway TrbF-like protein